ncbi:hypothetical protein Daus18300_002929 [Diaporthe australafricana]|uniref:TPR domain-containing protein n=1 Tax=Diaporthe australafricana TaxID=127596 RepID=A0ABR3XKR4_9PEZI
MSPPLLAAAVHSDYYDLGMYHREITTSSEDAQLWFNRGLLWAYSFNHDEAVKCFMKATESDPECTMAWWGIAYALGPNYNKSWALFDREDLDRTLARAKTVLERAQSTAIRAQPVERALVVAMAARFHTPDNAPFDPKTLNNAYAEAMRTVYATFNQDLDICALFAESLICKRPRQLWDLDTGVPSTSDTVQARDVLEAAMRSPGGLDHPAIGHMYIHLMEMSPFPEKALLASDRLRHLVPDGSHLRHMATHIDIACGDYRRGIDSNCDAMIADDRYFETQQGSYLYSGYRSHNLHVLAYAAMMAGRSEDALMAATRLTQVITPELLSVRSPPMSDWLEYQLGTLFHVLIRFGRWEEILQTALPENPNLMSITTATQRYARGIALAVLGRTREARIEQEEFEVARRAVPSDRFYGLNCKASKLLDIASMMMEGELLYREGAFEEAFACLRQGIAAEDCLPYADPPLRMQPLRHVLGDLLLEQGRAEEAEEIYRQDLGLSPNLSRRKARLNNVWSWHGLYECLQKLGKKDDMRMFRQQRDIVVASADVPIGSSCFCRLRTAEVEGPVSASIHQTGTPATAHPCH